MAVIEYLIFVENGNATVVQDVREIGTPDKIRYVSNVASAIIRFPKSSPFKDLKPNEPYLVPHRDTPNPREFVPSGMADSQEEEISLCGSGDVVRRRTFLFECGELVNGVFQPWGGGGGTTPGGGSTGN